MSSGRLSCMGQALWAGVSCGRVLHVLALHRPVHGGSMQRRPAHQVSCSWSVAWAMLVQALLTRGG
jgi:hypothetical protein